MPTPRDILGNDVIKQLQDKGYQANHIRAMAQSAWDNMQQDQAALKDARQKDATKMDNSIVRFGAGVGKSALETANGYLKVADNVANFLDPLRKDQPNDVTHKIDGWINRINEYQKNYHATLPKDKWDIASTAGELAGGFIDPVNLVPIGTVNAARRVISFAATGALSGGLSAYGGNRNIAAGALTGAIATPLIGEALHQTASGLSKLWLKTKEARIKDAKTNQDFENISKNQLFDIPIMQKADSSGNTINTGSSLKPKQFDLASYVNETLAGKPQDIKTQVLKDAVEGKTQSAVDASTYKDIVAFKNHLDTMATLDYQEAKINIIENEVQKVNDQITQSTDASAVRFNDMTKGIQKEVKDNPQIMPSELKTLINAKYKPTPDEMMITNWVNDGMGVENRLAGWNVIHALNRDIANPIRTPDEYTQSLLNAGFGEEQAKVLTEAYAQGNSDIAKNYFISKISEKGAEHATAAAENISSQHNGDGLIPGGKTDIPRTPQSIGTDPQGGSSNAISNQNDQIPSIDNGSGTLPNDGQNPITVSQDNAISKGFDQVAGQQTSGSNGDSVSGSSGDPMVQQKDGSNTGPDVKPKEGVNVSKEKLRQENPLGTQTKGSVQNQKDHVVSDGQSRKISDTTKTVEKSTQNLDLRDSFFIFMSKSERKTINAEVDNILKKKTKKITQQDKEILRKYTGTGGIDSGTYGSLSEHYTPYETVRGIYAALDRSGVPMKKALEPAVGSGNFVGHKPHLDWTTIDTDPKAYKINKILYPDAKHYNTSFENFKGNGYDLIISNVPFIETRGANSIDVRPDIKALHDYYFVSAVDKAKDNGVITFVTSKGTMDKSDFKVRKELMDKSNIIGAYRLPEGTFSKNAHTDVGTDVIFLQKRPEGVSATGKQLAQNEAFIKSTKTQDGIYLNDYFQKNPQKILGKMEVGVNKQFGTKAYVVSGKADYSKMKLDYQKIKTKDHSLNIEKNLPTESSAFWKYADAHGLEAYGLDRKGIVLKDGRVEVSQKKIHFSDINDGAQIYKDITDTPDGKKISLLNEIARAGENQDILKGQDLIDLYRKNYKVHPYTDKSLNKLFAKIGEKEKLYELGSYFDKKFQPAQIFEQKTKFEDSGKLTVDSNSPIKSRLLYHEDNKGIVDISQGGEYIKKEDFHNALKEGYSVIAPGKLQNDILYYSGKLYDKLDNLNIAFEKYKDDGVVFAKLEKQKAALEELLPEKKTIENISLRGDEPWLLEKGIEIYPLRKVERTIQKGEQKIREYDTGFGPIFDNYINSKALISIKKDETMSSYRRRLREANDEVQSTLAKIKEKILSDPKLTKKIESIYNRKFNGYVSPDYGKASYLIQDTLKEIEPTLISRDNQIQWVTKSLYEGKGINAHDVGGGKTLSAVILARALKNKGAAKKPLFVVPSKVIGNWEKEIKRAFPDAKIVNLFNLEKSTRSKKLYELGNNSADYILISHEGFSQLKLPHDIEMRYVDELLNENLKTEDLKGRALALQTEKIKKYKELLRRENLDKRITIDNLGIDAIFADEARAFKNIGINSKLVNFKLGKPFSLTLDKNTHVVTLDSALAYDFRFKTRYISEKNNGKNIFMFDATPTPNKPMEIYTMLKHLDNSIFNEYGIYTDRDFADRFFDFGANMNKRGGIEYGLNAIKNAYDLRAIMDRYVERISMEDFKSKGIITLPDEKVNTHYLDGSHESDIVFSDIKKRLLEAKSDSSKRNKMMGIFSEGVSASTDPRAYQRAGVRDFIDPTPDNNKLESTIQKVLERRSKDKNAGQIIFLDNAGHEQQVPRDLNKDGNIFDATLDQNLHQEMKQKLLASKKYKPQEIAIISGKEITDPTTGKEIRGASGRKAVELKQAIVDAYDKGKVKVVIGTTKGAGEGMNIQKYTKDIYNVDIPWTPAELKQRGGRGIRFGNINDSVNVHYFFQAGTFDELMYKTVANKRGWNEALWDAKPKDRIEIVDGASAMPTEEEFMLQMEKDPVKRKELELQIEYNRLENELQAVNEEGYFLKSRRDAITRGIATTKKEISTLGTRLKSDRPNQYLGDLLEKIAKTKDPKKKQLYKADYEKKIVNAKANIQKMIDAKNRRILDQEAFYQKTLKDIENNQIDGKDAGNKLASFEDKHVGQNGKIKPEIVEEIC
ncbi:MAG: helicase-related protein [Sulfurospirillaceae bacterium]|nr:helicase-related protein [Sulfurospirillaceae bacterium]